MRSVKKWKKVCLGACFAGVFQTFLGYGMTAWAWESPSRAILEQEMQELSSGRVQEETTQETEMESLYLAVDHHQIPEEQLLDSVIEYEELGSLIHRNNPSVREVMYNTETTKQQYRQIRDSLYAEKSDADWKKDEAEDKGDMEEYVEYATLEATYKMAAKGYNSMLKRLNTSSFNNSRVTLEKQLTYATQNLMISCESIRQQKEQLLKMEEWYQAQYKTVQAKMRVGAATEADVQDSYHAWQEIALSVDSLEANEESIRESLCLILGMDEMEEIEIGEIPSADRESISQMNLEQDTETAVNNNVQIITERKTASDGTTEGIKKKQRTLEELEEKVRIKMQQLYEDVLQAEHTYETASVGYSSAEARWNNAQRKKELGMFSQTEYLQEELAYIQQKTNLEAADLTLFQAIENYHWAVNGIADLE